MTAAPETASPALPHKGWILTGLSLAILMSSLDTSIVNVALPALVVGLHTTFAAVQWVVLSYLLVVTALIVGIGRLGDLLGKRRLYLFGIALFTIASAACGFAGTVPVLIAARAVQGLGAAIMMALSFALAGDLFPRAEIGKVMGLLSGMVSLGFAMGPSLSGLLTGTLGWPSIFLVNIPFGIAACVVLSRYLPKSAPKQLGAGFDWLGTGILAAGLVAYALSMTLSEDRGFSDPLVLSLFFGGIVILFIFRAIEQRTPAPLLNLKLFHDPLLTTSIVMGVLIYAVMMSVVLLFPFFMGTVDHFSPQKIGLILSFGPLVTTLSSFLAGSVADRFGARKTMVGGLVGLVIGALLVSTVTPDTGVLGILARIGVLNFSLAFFQTPNNTAVISEASPAERGVVSGLLSLSRTLGLVTGASVMGAVFSAFIARANGSAHAAVASAPAPAVAAGLRHTFVFGAGLLLMAFLLGAWTLTKRSQTGAGTSGEIMPPVID